MGYFFLISPPNTSHHVAIPPSSIVLAGESVGAALALSLVQVLMHLQREVKNKTQSKLDGHDIPRIRIFGRDVPIELPAGCALTSPTVDLTLSLPSTAELDVNTDWLVGRAPWLRPDYPADHLWPSNPPRAEIFCDPAVICHPFLSVVSNRDWYGAPPIWLAVGDESSADGAKILAQRAAKCKVPVKYVRYEAMPHIFPMLLSKLPQSGHCLKRWGSACKEIFEPSQIWSQLSEVTTVHLGALHECYSRIEELTDLTLDEALEIMRAKRAELMEPRSISRGSSFVRSAL